MKQKTMNKKLRTIIGFAIVFALCMALASCSKSEPASDIVPVDQDGSSKTPADAQEDTVSDVAKADKPIIEITMENGGVITIELDPEAAPVSVENFLKLVNDGFYDGLTFHRIKPDFMIQGGDPDGTGTGGSSEKIQGEFASNGWDNPISHERGVISMARSQMPDSASSQFFITNADATYLDGEYAAFGRVLSGMEVVDEISAVDTDSSDYPLTPVIIKTIAVKGE